MAEKSKQKIKLKIKKIQYRDNLRFAGIMVGFFCLAFAFPAYNWFGWKSVLFFVGGILLIYLMMRPVYTIVDNKHMRFGRSRKNDVPLADVTGFSIQQAVKKRDRLVYFFISPPPADPVFSVRFINNPQSELAPVFDLFEGLTEYKK